jgi:hypothetical protein
MTLFGISDSELLHIVDDLADENGWATTYDVRHQLGEDLNVSERSGVGSRLGWLRHYGWLEKGERDRVETSDERGWRWSQTWRLTAMGDALLDNPKLSAAVEKSLGTLNPAQRLALTREIAESGLGAPAEIRVALRRQWTRSAGLARPRPTR